MKTLKGIGMEINGKKVLKTAIKWTVILALLAVFLYDQNNRITISNIAVTDEKIPDRFQDFKILQISDLHNKEFGKNQATLIKKTKEINPNIIVITGDFIGYKDVSIEKSMEYIWQATAIAPIFFVPGNHERMSSLYKELEKQLLQAGVYIIGNEDVYLEKGKESIRLLGMNDPTFFRNGLTFEGELSKLMDTKYKGFQILLSHRPELINLYQKYKVDLVLSGHAHGGQFRFLFLKGVIAPNQGLFPKYTSGLYEKEGTKMIVSRGLGNSVVPQRIGNRPELVVITLKTTSDKN